MDQQRWFLLAVFSAGLIGCIVYLWVLGRRLRRLKQILDVAPAEQPSSIVEAPAGLPAAQPSPRKKGKSNSVLGTEVQWVDGAGGGTGAMREAAAIPAPDASAGARTAGKSMLEHLQTVQKQAPAPIPHPLPSGSDSALLQKLLSFDRAGPVAASLHEGQPAPAEEPPSSEDVSAEETSPFARFGALPESEPPPPDAAPVVSPGAQPPPGLFGRLGEFTSRETGMPESAKERPPRPVSAPVLDLGGGKSLRELKPPMGPPAEISRQAESAVPPLSEPAQEAVKPPSRAVDLLSKLGTGAAPAARVSGEAPSAAVSTESLLARFAPRSASPAPEAPTGAEPPEAVEHRASGPEPRAGGVSSLLDRFGGGPAARPAEAVASPQAPPAAGGPSLLDRFGGARPAPPQAAGASLFAKLGKGGGAVSSEPAAPPAPPAPEEPRPSGPSFGSLLERFGAPGAPGGPPRAAPPPPPDAESAVSPPRESLLARFGKQSGAEPPPRVPAPRGVSQGASLLEKLGRAPATQEPAAPAPPSATPESTPAPTLEPIAAPAPPPGPTLEAAAPRDLSTLEQAVMADPNDVAAKRALGEAYLEAGHVEYAIEALGEAVESAEAQPSDFYLLGLARKEAGDADSARQLFELTSRQFRGTPWAGKALGQLLKLKTKTPPVESRPPARIKLSFGKRA